VFLKFGPGNESSSGNQLHRHIFMLLGPAGTGAGDFIGAFRLWTKIQRDDLRIMLIDQIFCELELFSDPRFDP